MNNANSNMRILIVDDEPEFQEAYKTLLNDAGYVAVVSGSGKDALSKLESLFSHSITGYCHAEHERYASIGENQKFIWRKN